VPDCTQIVRFWDLAMSAKTSADYTVGVKLGTQPSGRLAVLDVVRQRVEWEGVKPLIAETALGDGPQVRVGIEEKGYMSRAIQQLVLDPDMHPYAFFGYPKEVDKLTNALPFAARVGAGVVDVVQAHWTREYLDELCAFNKGAHDDQVDASAGAYTMLGEGTGEDGDLNYATPYVVSSSPY
jgi:predicted phage terminase large subunit-like protein